MHYSYTCKCMLCGYNPLMPKVDQVKDNKKIKGTTGGQDTM